MAKVLGETARYVTKQSVKKLQKVFSFIFLVISGTAFATGYLIGVKNTLLGVILSVMFVIVVPFIIKRVNRTIDELETERINFRKGAVGEAVIGYILGTFPDEYRVIHDLSTPFGNIDHVVVGPRGAYVVDTKNWRGVVTADGNGELLWNGEPTNKHEVKNLTRTIMSIKEKIKVLCEKDPYVQGVFAFPSARVEAKWGTTGHVHCITDEGLYKYIVENKKATKLSEKEIDSVSRAFLALAKMDKDFTRDNG